MDRNHKTIYVGGSYEKYYDALQRLADKEDKSFSEMLAKAVKEYTG